MTPQMLHATLSTGQIIIWEDRLDVTPKTPQQVLGWLQREEGLRACGFDELDREMQYRLKTAADQGVPMTNYGIAIACMQGILRRSVAMFPAVQALLEEDF